MFISKEHYDSLIELAHNGEKYERISNEIISKWKDTIELNGNILAHLSSLESQNNMLVKKNNELLERLSDLIQLTNALISNETPSPIGDEITKYRVVDGETWIYQKGPSCND